MENPYVMTFRPLRAYREINASLHELDEANSAAEQHERLALASSTTRFCQNSKKVVDGTMSLSAVLMRAGEVDEAQRLLAEVDRDVEQEKAALIGVMNEVSKKKAERSHRMTRLRLARLLVSAVLGASLMTFSAFGVALANYFTDRVSAGETATSNISVASTDRDTSRAFRRVELAPGLKVQFTQAQFKEYERLSSASADPAELESFLRDMLPAGMLDKVTSLLAAKDLDGKVSSTVSTVKGAVKKAAGYSASASDSQGSSQASSDDEGNSGSSGSSSKKKEQSDKDSSGGGSQQEEGCEEPKEGDDGDSTPLGGNCIPVVNQENPLG